jgi:methylated-DNA-[protein]-cysteine S-methyltransferase
VEPVGWPVTMACTDAGLCLLHLRASADSSADPHHPILEEARSQLQAYFAGRLRDFDVPLVLKGTPFQQRVWEELQRIPYGETRSYAELAASVGSPRAIRAVGTANGRNPIAVIVPCHRVINTGGGLGGYATGLDHKRWLLDLEAAQTSMFKNSDSRSHSSSMASQ